MAAKLKPAEFEALFGEKKPRRKHKHDRKGAYADLNPYAWPVESGEGFIRAILPEPPSANRYWRHTVVGEFASVFVSTEAKEYRWAIRSILLGRCDPIRGAIRFTYRWYRGRAVGDLDNRQKQLLDALGKNRDGKKVWPGVAWNDDGQIVELHGYRSDDPSWPRVEIEIEALAPLGLFGE